MPTYEYSCPVCGSAFEALRKVSERDQTIACPSCGTAAERRISAPRFMANGLSRSGPEWRPYPGARPLNLHSKPQELTRPPSARHAH